jgi:hypothetical protein
VRLSATRSRRKISRRSSRRSSRRGPTAGKVKAGLARARAYGRCSPPQSAKPCKLTSIMSIASRFGKLRSCPQLGGRAAGGAVGGAAGGDRQEEE